MKKTYIVKDQFCNGEAPAKASKPHFWPKGSIYTGEQGEKLLKEGLLELAPPPASDEEAKKLAAEAEARAKAEAEKAAADAKAKAEADAAAAEAAAKEKAEKEAAEAKAKAEGDKPKGGKKNGKQGE